jgi:hypothetical protein
MERYSKEKAMNDIMSMETKSLALEAVSRYFQKFWEERIALREKEELEADIDKAVATDMGSEINICAQI